jgi:hypothetical protein
MAETRHETGATPPPDAAPDDTPPSSLEEEFVAALHAHFRENGVAKIVEIAQDPVAYLRLIAQVRDRSRSEDAIDRMTLEEVEREIIRIEQRIGAAARKAKAQISQA